MDCELRFAKVPSIFFPLKLRLQECVFWSFLFVPSSSCILSHNIHTTELTLCAVKLSPEVSAPFIVMGRTGRQAEEKLRTDQSFRGGGQEEDAMLHKASLASVGEGMIKKKLPSQRQSFGKTEDKLLSPTLRPVSSFHAPYFSPYFKILQFFSIHLSIFSLKSNPSHNSEGEKWS